MNGIAKYSLLAIALAAGGATAHTAVAAMENDAAAIAAARISLIEAVTVAERHVNGKATRAEYEKSRQGWVYDVEVADGSTVFDVRVDADKGTVISSVEDKADGHDDHDERD